MDPTVKTHYLVVATAVVLMYVTGRTYLIRTVNALYLESSSYGIDCFQNEDVDPFYATTVEIFDKRVVDMKQKIRNTKRKQDIIQLKISSALSDRFQTSTQNEQSKIVSMIKFDFINIQVRWFHCMVCNGQFLEKDQKHTKGVCSSCKTKKKDFDKLVKDDYVPVWVDADGVIRCDIPEVLKNLTVGEKLLIQKYAVLMPVVHLYKGTLGIKGHTVMFPKDFTDICNELPRKKVDMVYIIKEYENCASGELCQQTFKIRRQKVLSALQWLKQNHSGYKDIKICPENLDWMEPTRNEQSLNEDSVSFFKRTECDDIDTECDETETVAKTQTHTMEDNQESMEFQGSVPNDYNSKGNNDDKSMLNDLLTASQKVDKDITALMFPFVDETPVNEYKTKGLFADAYPWLFPSGSGDITRHKLPGEKKAYEWTEMLMRWKDGRFLRDPLFVFHIPNYVQRHINNNSALYFVKTFISDSNITVTQIQEQIEKRDLSFINKLMAFSGSKIKGSDGWWRDRKYELDSWISHHLREGNGPPTLFLTLSCAEYWWPDLCQLIQDRCNGTEDELLANLMRDDPDSVAGKKAKHVLIDRYSGVIQEFFQIRTDNWLETVGKDVFGISHYYCRFEFAKGRGQIHAHILAITKDTHLIYDVHKKMKEKNPQGAADILSSYARGRLDMTEELSDDTNKTHNANYVNPLLKKFSEINDIEEDGTNLCKEVHIHECNSFCLRLPRLR